MDTSKIDHHIGRLLARLSKLQKDDGSWSDNNFVTGLVACSLAEIKNGSEGAGDGNGRGKNQNRKIKTSILKMLRKTIAHILSEKSEGWSWNYYPRSNPKYPDDLDDTCVSLISLVRMRRDPDLSGSITLDDRAFAHIAELLMNAEMREGGPYNTWLVKNQRHWRDVDPAVNANISYFLSLSGISLPRLTSYLDKILRKNRCHSKYYHNPLLVMYFISRGYVGKEKQRIIAQVKKRHMPSMPHISPDGMDIFDTVLSASIYMNLGEPVEKISPYVERVMRFCNARCRKGAKNCATFPAPELYIERRLKGSPPENGHIHGRIKVDIIYARSEAVLVALCAEMLSAYRAYLIRDTNKKKEDSVYLTIVRESEKILKNLPADLRRDGHVLLSQTLEHDKDRTIGLLPARMAHHAVSKISKGSKDLKRPEGPENQKIPFDTIVQCGLISLYGWIAYTIYDDAIDGENIHLRHIPLANIFHREMIALAGTMSPEIQSLFRHVMNILDSAEYKECQNRISDIRAPAVSLRPSSLSNNAWRKSAGFMFPSACVMMRAGHGLESPLLKQLIRFFRHYLSAKQIADDIRDWEEDILNGIRTPVTAFIIKARSENISLNAATAMKAVFLEHALEPSAREVLRHAVSARKILASGTMRQNFFDTAFLLELVKPHEEAARKTLERQIIYKS